jgi:hypothetical protein
MDSLIYMDKPTATLAQRINSTRRAQGVTLTPLAESTLQTMLESKGNDFPASFIFMLAHELKADAASWMTDLPAASKPVQVAA